MIKRNARKMLTEKSQGKRPLEKVMHTWEVNIKLDVSELKYKHPEWIQVAENRVN
jgi:hypothetical protein